MIYLTATISSVNEDITKLFIKYRNEKTIKFEEHKKFIHLQTEPQID